MAPENKDLNSIDSEDKSVLYSNNLMKAFETKAEEFNSQSERKVTASQLKSIYINAVNHEVSPDKKNLYAFARINLFFDIMSGKESFLTGVKNVGGANAESVNLADLRGRDRVERAIDFFESRAIGESYYIRAEKDVNQFNVAFRLDSLESQLFITNKKKSNYSWELL